LQVTSFDSLAALSDASVQRYKSAARAAAGRFPGEARVKSLVGEIAWREE
jgi:hypothetical protein